MQHCEFHLTRRFRRGLKYQWCLPIHSQARARSANRRIRVQRCSEAAITYAPPIINRRSTLINADCGVNRSLRPVQLVRRHCASWPFSFAPLLRLSNFRCRLRRYRNSRFSPYVTLNKNRIADASAHPAGFFRNSKLGVSVYAAGLGISKCSSAALKCASISLQHLARSPITNASRRSIPWQTSGAPPLSTNRRECLPFNFSVMPDSARRHARRARRLATRT